MLDGLGVLELINSWKCQANNYLDQWNAWYTTIKQKIISFIAQNGNQIESTSLVNVNQVLESIQALDNKSGVVSNCSQDDLEDYKNPFVDSLTWMNGFLQVCYTAN